MRLGMLLAAALLLGCHRVPDAAPEPVTTVVIVRHAEKASDTDPDSPLSEAGRARAEALVHQLVPFRPDVLVVSQRRRTAETFAPLAHALRLTPLVRDNEKVSELAAELLRDFKGRTVAIAWHHGPHEPLVRALGVQGDLPKWTARTYDRIWIVRIAASGARFEERTQQAVPAR
jgi:broad specificity phosphatase PhoE